MHPDVVWVFSQSIHRPMILATGPNLKLIAFYAFERVAVH